MRAKSVMKTLSFKTPPPCLSLMLSLSLSEPYPRPRKEEEFYKKSFYLGEKKVKPSGGQTHQKALSFFLSSVLCVCVYFRSLAVCSRGVFIHFIFQCIRIFGETHETHNTRDITNWKTTSDTHKITERDTERERYTRNTHVVVLLRLLFFISHRCAFLRGGANDVVERRTTTTSKEDENDEVDAQENGKDTSLKLRDDDEFIETRQNDDE